MNPILVELTRGGITESFHRGVICVVDKEGEIVFSVGDVKQICYPRSALKFIQHIPLLTSGIFDHYHFTLKDLALMCGSHNGEKQHVDAVNLILQKIGLEPSALKCGAQNPTRKSDWIDLIKKGEFAQPLHNNCSGKHAGFLAYNTYHNCNINSYLSSDFELQVRIKETVSRFAELPAHELNEGIDGCSAPTYAMPVYNQAIIYKNLIAPNSEINTEERTAAQRVIAAVSEFPEMVVGTKRYCTDLMNVTKGRIIGKTGADGVYCLAIPEKQWGISIKVDDGKMGPQYQIAQELLRKLELITEEEAQLLNPYREFDIPNFAGNMASHSRVVNL